MQSSMVARIDRINRAHPWSHNDHYHRWVLRQIPRGTTRSLDVGCGTGNLVRALSRVVDLAEGIDADREVITIARRASPGYNNVTFQVRSLEELPAEPVYDVVTALAVVHHLPLTTALERMGEVLRPGGRLVVLGCYRPATFVDHTVGLVAVPANLLLGRIKHAAADAARLAMSAPTAPAPSTLREIRSTAAEVLSGARVRRRLFWRYSLVYDRPVL